MVGKKGVQRCGNEPIDFKNEVPTIGKTLSSCYFNVTEELPSECTNHSNNYGYADGNPCIFVRLNKVGGCLL